MNSIGKLLVNMGLAYSVMKREDFVERFTELAEKYQYDPEKVKELTEVIFSQLEDLHAQRKASCFMKPESSETEEELRKEIKELKNAVSELAEAVKQLKK
jgi:DNA repair ATPase RecN